MDRPNLYLLRADDIAARSQTFSHPWSANSQVAGYRHTSLSNAFRLTDVWSRIDGTWQVVARHSSILS